MKKMAQRSNNISATIFLALILLLAYQNLSAQDQSPLELNKQLLLDFFAFEGTRIERMERFLAEDYVQHSPQGAIDKGRLPSTSMSLIFVDAPRSQRFLAGHPRLVSTLIPLVIVHLMWWTLAVKYDFFSLYPTRYRLFLVC